MCGPIFSDTFNMSLYLINEAGVRLKLFQSKHNFRLMSSVAGKKYKEIIVEVMLKADMVGIHSDILKSHARALKDTPATAIYPFNKTDVKTFAVPKGQYDMNLDDIFQGKYQTDWCWGWYVQMVQKQGNLQLQIRFAEALPEAINAIL